MVYKFIGATIILVAVAFGVVVFKDEFETQKTEFCSQLTPAQQLTRMIDEDFAQLNKEGQLPKEWNSIATVELRMNSTLAKALMGKHRPTFHRVKDGSSFLELEVMDLPDDENPGIIIQASLFDIKSKNKVFEIGRTYTMNDLNRPSAAKPQK
ncbi:hypothetical protein AZI86_16885 [Bdellovibrio bacteriovorus]|uniref:Uncharacterized protein n=1 Tax=Bdellovibrio bacteriovorus TaxID=959 RepID=A0A150WEC7_BDEBC|nr:hypothetical protein [Bdellovibrio bacteriovorus]KYG61389.1 hypothetical protein AZI86_16885 [Bdellovibrio bacteriovorus]